ncbi:MAG: glycosyltransferase family 39 protein [Clostridia bacterium]|nr:glycosyltransferase family 39 protein [Clostridia bacterium]
MKKINFKYCHIAILILGTIFIALSIFHTNMWFDESYSVAIVKHSFSEIWQIGSKDVHPILYYFCLHALNLIFGNNLIVYRIFSATTIALLGLLGYTHIRKDFGEKTGILFSFFALFLPVAAQYAGEIRMYSLGMLLGTIMAIYAYRIYIGNIHKTTYLFFGLSSLAVAYTHYYGLMLAGIVNLLLLIYLCKNHKQRKSDLKKFIITAVLQVLGYLPWLLHFIKQVSGVSKGFWITLSFPGTLYDILTIQYQGNLKYAPIILSTLLYAYLIYLISRTEKKERKPAIWCLEIYVSIILAALLISLVMHSAILLSRYLLISTGLLIFALAFFIARDKKSWRAILVCAIVLVMSGISNRKIVQENYAVANREWFQYMQSTIQADDIIVYRNAINGAVVTTELSNICNNQSYFYDKEHWNVDEPYKSYGPYMQIKDTLEEILENYKGRIWLIESGNMHELKDEIAEKYDITVIEEKQFEVPYRNYAYTIELIEKR